MGCFDDTSSRRERTTPTIIKSTNAKGKVSPLRNLTFQLLSGGGLAILS
jgi:hypothetical protein